MKRMTDPHGKVHFVGANGCTLCGVEHMTRTEDLFTVQGANWPETTSPVTCPDCARLYCAVKNAPWPEVNGDVLDRAIYAAVPGCTGSEGGAE